MARLLRLCAWVYVGWIVGVWGIWRPFFYPAVDFGKHWLAARALADGANVYDGWELYLGFNYPQWVAFVYFWLGLTACDTAKHVWNGMNLGLLVATWWVAWQALRPLPAPTPAPSPLRAGLARHWGVTTALTLALFQPATTCLPAGNVDPYNTVLAVALAAALLARRDAWAGVWWALLILCKLLPVSLVVPLVLWRRWRVLRSAAVVLAGYGLLLAVTGRLGYEWYFLRRIVPAIGFHWRWLSLSIPRALLLLFGLSEWYNHPESYRLCTMAILLALAALYCAALWWLRRRRVSLERSLELAFLAVPLMAPLLEFHHFVFSLPTVLLMLRRWALGKMGTVWAVVYLLAWLNLAQSYTYLDLWPSNPLVMDFTALFSVAVLLVAMIWELAREKAGQRVDDDEDAIPTRPATTLIP
jgi:hypothetical protein